MVINKLLGSPTKYPEKVEQMRKAGPGWNEEAYHIPTCRFVTYVNAI